MSVVHDAEAHFDDHEHDAPRPRGAPSWRHARDSAHTAVIVHVAAVFFGFMGGAMLGVIVMMWAEPHYPRQSVTPVILGLTTSVFGVLLLIKHLRRLFLKTPLWLGGALFTILIAVASLLTARTPAASIAITTAGSLFTAATFLFWRSGARAQQRAQASPPQNGTPSP